MNWNDSVHALGIDEMYRTHQEFTELVNRLIEASDAEFVARFGKLLDHCRQHFNNEGRLMRLSRFPALNEHEGEHNRVYGDLVRLHRAVLRGRLVLPRAFVNQGLEDWFALHLSSMDAALAAHLKRVGVVRVMTGGGPSMPM